MQSAEETLALGSMLRILGIKELSLCAVLVDQHGSVVVEEAPAYALAQTYPVGGKVHYSALAHVSLCDPDEMAAWAQKGVGFLENGERGSPEGVVFLDA